MSPLTVQDSYTSHQPAAALDSNQPPPLADLPPVEAPSASFVVQLFVIPAVVVAVVIVVWLLFGKLAGGERDAMEYVRQLRLSSANWRSAFELASLIQNDSQLARDPRLLGELTDLLSFELKQNENPRLTQYVALTLGAFQTLDATLADGRKVDPIEPLDAGARAEIRDADQDRRRRQPGQASRPAARHARRSSRGSGAGSGGYRR